MTATPRIVRKSETTYTTVASMSDANLYGRVVFRLPLQDAIRRELICDYRIVIASVSPESNIDLHSLETKKSRLKSNHASISDCALLFALVKSIREVGARRIITYHYRIDEAKAFSALCRSTPAPGTDSPIPACHVNGTMSVMTREKALTDFRAASIGLVTNVRVMNEGIDIPDVDMVALIAPRHSVVDIAQICGRVLRLHPESGKKLGYIFIPLFIKEADFQDPDSVLASPNLQNVVDAIHAMAAVDEDLRRSLLNRRNGVPDVDSSPEIPGKIIVDAPKEIQSALWDAISVQVLNRLEPSSERQSSSWEDGINELSRFIDEYGHRSVPIDFVTSTCFRLGNWRVRQQQDAAKGILTVARKERLEALGLNLAGC